MGAPSAVAVEVGARAELEAEVEGGVSRAARAVRTALEGAETGGAATGGWGSWMDVAVSVGASRH